MVEALLATPPHGSQRCLFGRGTGHLNTNAKEENRKDAALLARVFCADVFLIHCVFRELWV